MGYAFSVRKILLILVSLCSFAQAAILPVGSGPVSKIDYFTQVEDKKFFPKVNGANLEGEIVNIPLDLEGKKKLLLVAFKREQQEDVNTWLSATVDLLKDYPDFAVYEIPTIKKMNFLMRFNINNGMRYGIDSKEQREKTITLFIDKEEFKKALDIDTEENIYAFLLNENHEIVWRAQGLASKSYIYSIEEYLEND